MNLAFGPAGPPLVLVPAPVMPLQNISPASLQSTLLGLNIGNAFVFQGEYRGTQARIFRFCRDNGESIAVCVEHPRCDSATNIIDSVRRHVLILQKLEHENFQWSPRCLAFCLTFDNPLRYPFLVLAWAEGEPLHWTTHAPAGARLSLLRQLNKIQVELISCTLENKPETAKAYYTRRIIQKAIHTRPLPPQYRALMWHPDFHHLWREDYASQLAQLDHVLGRDTDNTLYACSHDDIKAGNIIIDKDFNIQCIIDWGSAGIVPICQAAILPRCLAPKTSIHAMVPPSEAMIKDRADYTHQLLREPLTPAVSAMLRWQGNADAPYRQLYMLSLLRNDVHLYMARTKWKPSYFPFAGDPPRRPMTPLRGSETPSIKSEEDGSEEDGPEIKAEPF